MYMDLFLATGLGATILYGLYFMTDTILAKKGKPNVWMSLETVGVSSAGRFQRWYAIIASISSTRSYATEGYNRISKAANLPFAIPTTWTTSRAVIVVPPSMLHSMLSRPDKLPENEIRNIFGLIETIQLPYVIGDPDIYMNALHFDVVRRKMSKKDMPFFASSQAEEIDLAFKEIWGTSREWTTINGWDGCGRIIARAAERMMLGLPLGRNKELLDNSRHYANSVLIGGSLINCIPPWLRKLIAPVIALRAKYYQRRCVQLLVPIIDERIQIFRRMRDGEFQDNSDVPDDFLQWLVATCAKDGDHQLHSPRIANRLIALMTPLIFAVCYVFASSVLDLYGSPAKEEFLSGLEAECARVSAVHDGLATTEAVDKLYRIDSTIRESMRLSDVAVINLYRDVTAGQLDLGNNIVVPPGVRMAFPTQNIHLDSSNYNDPHRFDAFRFSRKFEGLDDNRLTASEKAERELIVTPTTSFLPLGYGKHACPGRWFAAQTMKQAFAYIVMNYDIELVGKPVKRMALLNAMLPPVNKQLKIRWKGSQARESK